MEKLNDFLVAFGDFAWGPPLLVLLLGGGLFFLVYSRLIPFRYFGHAIQILRGKYDDPDDPGDVSHFQARLVVRITGHAEKVMSFALFRMFIILI